MSKSVSTTPRRRTNMNATDPDPSKSDVRAALEDAGYVALVTGLPSLGTAIAANLPWAILIGTVVIPALLAGVFAYGRQRSLPGPVDPKKE